MPYQPGRGSVHVNRPLTNMSVAFIQNSSNFVASRVFPVVPVEKQSDKYFIYNREDWNRDQMKKRAPATESAGSGWEMSTDSYLAEVWALHKDLADQVVANYDSPLNAQRDTVTFLTGAGLLRKEIAWRDRYFTSGVPGDIWFFVADGATSPGSLPAVYNPADVTDTNNKVTFWNDYANSNPIENVRAAKRFMQARTGIRPNVMVMGRIVYDILIDHPDIVGRLDRGQTPNGPAVANVDSLAALFELDEIIIMDAIVNTGAEGLAEVNNFVGGKHALLAYRPPVAGLLIPSAGYTFAWTGFIGGGGINGARIKSFYMDKLEAERIEIEMAFDHKRVSEELGFFFNEIVE